MASRTSMRRLVVSLVVVGQLLLVPTVSATDSGSIPAEVTLDAPCILIDAGTVDFGTLRFDGVSSETKGFSLCHSIGNAFIYGSATDASSTGGASWTLVTSPVACHPSGAPDEYDVSAGVSAPAEQPAFIGQLGTAPTRIFSAPSGPLTLHANLHVPCDGSSGAGQTMTFTIQLTASFS